MNALEIELLGIISEESGEVVQAVGKILRHGFESNWDNGPTNRESLFAEITDVLAALELLIDFNVLSNYPTVEQIQKAKSRKLNFMHNK